MSPSKDTQIVTARVNKALVKEANQRAKRRNITLNSWVNWAIKQGVRSHHKKEAQNDNGNTR